MSIFVLLKYLLCFSWLFAHFVSFLFNNVLFKRICERFLVLLTIFAPFPQDSRRRFSVGIRSVEVEKSLLKMNKEEM
jgi:hypothetical protein